MSTSTRESPSRLTGRSSQKKTSNAAASLTETPPRPSPPSSVSESTPAEQQSKRLGKVAQDLVVELLGKVSDDVKAEITSAGQEYALMEAMNVQIRDRYAEYELTAQNLVGFSSQLRSLYDEMEPYVKQIDEIERQVSEIETIAIELDAYTKRLESDLSRRKKKPS
ncbi:biogenesis of lysosome-related organelles complex-1 subunit 2-domain-containing protein [Cladochytrium replicatum]|nr:biogenesis of lysosome-related organelles complex-1 subunit 2-domain-containing protein [Cladochytrium replicatum]